jgi:tetratricopeptide (TPR) repeat protein
LAEPNERKEAVAALEKWVRANPAFAHWWYLYCYEREIGQYNDALTAIQNAVQYPLENVDADERLTPQAFAYEAALYAYQMKNYQLVLDVTKVWASPRGDYLGFDYNICAFRAAAELSLGQFDKAKRDAAEAVDAKSKHALTTQHLAELQKAANEEKKDFVYDPQWGMGWMLFYPQDQQ